MCKVDSGETSMGDGIRTALTQIDQMQNELQMVNNDFYVPILIFMTDGTPTDDPRNEFALVRERVQNKQLHIFPLGIGDSADMIRLRDFFPVGSVPDSFEYSYKMVAPDDYSRIFDYIKNSVKKRQKVLVSEGDSYQSTPEIMDANVINNQMGTSIYDMMRPYV